MTQIQQRLVLHRLRVCVAAGKQAAGLRVCLSRKHEHLGLKASLLEAPPWFGQLAAGAHGEARDHREARGLSPCCGSDGGSMCMTASLLLAPCSCPIQTFC
jgi:hypothetical protein